MTKLIKLSIIPLMMGVTAANATNGTNLFGFTTVNQGMGGTGLAYPAGSSSALINPSLIKGNEVSFGVTYFQPTVATDASGSVVDSAMDKSVIPNLTFAFDVNDKVSVGLGMYGSAGVGVDYRDDTNANSTQMLTNLQNMKFAVPVAYQVTEDLRVGAALVALYGSLDMSYNNGAMTKNPADGLYTIPVSTGFGVSQDYGFGYELGVAYKIPMNDITLAAVYQSSISMKYDNQIGNAATLFGLTGIGDALDQPSEYGVGVSYQKHIGNVTHVFNADYKNIAWADAAGYQDFAWEDQNVFAVGYEYNRDKLALRAGYNYATSPISEQDGATYKGAVTNYFNLVGFPAIVESHYTTGASYQLTDKIRIDASYVYTPEKEETFDTSAMTAAQTMGAVTESAVTTTHSQSTLAVGFNIKF